MRLISIYRCADCDVTRTTAQGAPVPLCGTCRGPMKWTRTQEYRAELHGWSTGMKSAAIDFNQTAGRVAPIGEHGIEVNSLHDIRRIEREAERAVRNGDPGAELLVFRKYSQNASNVDVGTLGDSPAVRPSQDWLRRQNERTGRPFKEPVSQEEAEATLMGPSAREELASTLPD